MPSMHRYLLAGALALAACAAQAAPPVPPAGEAAFWAENDAAMTRMMNDMDVPPAATSTRTSWR